MTAAIHAPRTVAVVGAGVAGLTLAARLHAAGVEVRVFDKSRGLGGRLATRRADGLRFDHGTSGFTAAEPAFREVVAGWCAAGAAAPWPGPFGRLGAGVFTPEPGPERFVGLPNMNGVGRRLGAGLDVAFEHEARAVEPDGRGWRLRLADGATAGPFAATVIATPLPQAVPLLAAAPELAARAAAVPYRPNWTALLAFEASLDLGFAAARVDDPAIAWLGREASKPGRPDAEAWVVQASDAWSRARLEDDRERAAEALRHELARLLGRRLPEVIHQAGHRWRYAFPEVPLGVPCLWDGRLRLGVCGDGCLGGRVGAAWASGVALADRLLDEGRAA